MVSAWGGYSQSRIRTAGPCWTVQSYADSWAMDATKTVGVYVAQAMAMPTWAEGRAHNSRREQETKAEPKSLEEAIREQVEATSGKQEADKEHGNTQPDETSKKVPGPTEATCRKQRKQACVDKSNAVAETRHHGK